LNAMKNKENNKSLTEVTLWEEIYVYKYQLDKDFSEKSIDFIIDAGIRDKVRQRFKERSGQKEHPLKDISITPIWLNEIKKIPITSVRCDIGRTELKPLHISKKGLTLKLKEFDENSILKDFVISGNNHHIAIYEKINGELEEKTVSLWEAVQRKLNGLPTIVKYPNKTWDVIIKSGLEDQDFLNNFPLPEWKFITSLQQNELFIFRMSRDEIIKKIELKDLKTISSNLYRVQKITKKDYFFRLHLETRLEKNYLEAKEFISLGKLIRITSLETFKKMNPIKIRIDSMGNISIMDS